MIALMDQTDHGCFALLTTDGRGVRLFANSGHDDQHGPALQVQIDVSLNDAEVWLAAMLDRVRAAKAVKP